MQKLLVPENIPLRSEIWRGFGWPEARRSLVLLSPSLIILTLCLIFSTRTGMIVAMLLVILTAFFCVFFFTPMEQNQSAYEFLIRKQRFQREQQLFLYKEKDEVIYHIPENQT